MPTGDQALSLEKPAFRLQLVVQAHRDTLAWALAELERWRWECERLREENASLQRERQRPRVLL
jgi:hypothetical protein